MEHSQVLCILNTRDQAKRLYNLLGDREGHFHLSALMCPEHRAEVFEKVRKNLKEGLTCRVISTQLVEAGVDVDFPLVYRAIAGLDSIVQSAGRCNRENRMKDMGTLFVFVPESGLPGGDFKQPAQITEKIINKYGEDILGIETVKKYFNELFWIKSLGKSLDEKQILDDLKRGESVLDFPFKSIAEKYRLIDQTMIPVVIPYNEKAKKGIEEFRSYGPKSTTLRLLQRYTIGLYP